MINPKELSRAFRIMHSLSAGAIRCLARGQVERAELLCDEIDHHAGLLSAPEDASAGLGRAYELFERRHGWNFERACFNDEG